jgi:hypothetical protein
MCIPQIENVIKKEKEKTSMRVIRYRQTFGYRWDGTEMRPRAGGGMKEGVSHDAGKKSMK